jgi:hypothetical protein
MGAAWKWVCLPYGWEKELWRQEFLLSAKNMGSLGDGLSVGHRVNRPLETVVGYHRFPGVWHPPHRRDTEATGGRPQSSSAHSRQRLPEHVHSSRRAFPAVASALHRHSHAPPPPSVCHGQVVLWSSPSASTNRPASRCATPLSLTRSGTSPPAFPLTLFAANSRLPLTFSSAHLHPITVTTLRGRIRNCSCNERVIAFLRYFGWMVLVVLSRLDGIVRV